MNALLRSMDGESDRGAILLGTSVIHDLLKQALLGYMSPHVPWKSSAPDQIAEQLETFSTCIDLAQRLGLLGVEVYKDLHRLRDMRNALAHGWTPPDFNASPFKERVTDFYRHFPGTVVEDLFDAEPLPLWGATTWGAAVVRALISIYVIDVNRLRVAVRALQPPVTLSGPGIQKSSADTRTALLSGAQPGIAANKRDDARPTKPDHRP